MDRWASYRCAACILLVTIACGRPPERTLDDIAERYVRAALALAQHQPSLVDQWRGDESWRPGPRVPVAETRGDIAALIRAVAPESRGEISSAERARADYLRRQLQALDRAAGRLLGEQTPFVDEIVGAYGMPPPAVDTARVQLARERLARALPGPGSLGERHAAFRRSLTVPSGLEEEVLRAAFDSCRQRTREHMELPADESIDLRVGVDSTWDGFARYEGHHRSAIEISGRSALDVSRALHLACHEAYPGHHVQYVLLDAAAMQGRPELLLNPAFGPHLLIAEGAAEVGADLAFPSDERVRLYREVLLPRAGLPPDRAEAIVSVESDVFALESTLPEMLGAYLDSRASRDATIHALSNDAAVMDPEALIAFAERQRTRAVAYVLGRHLVDT